MLGKEIRKARLAAGLTQEQLGFAAGVSREYVNQLEQDKSSPSLEMLLKLCRAMKISAADLVRAVEEGGKTGDPQGIDRKSAPDRRGMQKAGAVQVAPIQRLLGQLLHRWRRDTGKTRREIAVKLDLRTEDVLSAEEGERPVTLVEFLRWCEVCHKDGNSLPNELARAIGYPPSWLT